MLRGQRRREWSLVALSLVALLVVVPFLVELLVGAWASRGPVFRLVVGIANAVGGTVATVDAFLVGLVVAWLVLFALDAYKRVQAGLLLLSAPVFFLALRRQDRWLFPWADHLLPLALGLALGIALGQVGGGGRTRTGGGGDGSRLGAGLPVVGSWQFEFPTAGRLLYATAGVVAVVGLLERYVLAPTLGGRPAGAGVDPATPVGVLVDLAVVVTFVVLVGYFTAYEDRSDVTVLCDDPELLASTVGWLYEAASRFDAMPGDRVREKALIRARTAPEEADLSGRIAFRFRRPGPLSRWRVISADTPRPLDDGEIERLESRVGGAGLPGRLVRLGWRRLRALAPRVLSGGSGSVDNVERVDESDAVLFVVSVSDFVDEARLAAGEFDDWRELLEDGGYDAIRRYVRVGELYRGRPPAVYVVAADAEVALDLSAARPGSSRPDLDGITPFVVDRILGADYAEDANYVEFVPVSGAVDEGEGSRGFERLLESL